MGEKYGELTHLCLCLQKPSVLLRTCFARYFGVFIEILTIMLL